MGRESEAKEKGKRKGNGEERKGRPEGRDQMRRMWEIWKKGRKEKKEGGRERREEKEEGDKKKVARRGDKSDEEELRGTMRIMRMIQQHYRASLLLRPRSSLRNGEEGTGRRDEERHRRGRDERPAEATTSRGCTKAVKAAAEKQGDGDPRVGERRFT